MDDLINVNKKDPQVRIKKKDMLNRYIRLLYTYQSKIGYDTLIQNKILEELIKIMDTTITEMDIELKMKFSKVEHLESKNKHY